MTGLGIQAWVLPLIGVRSALLYCHVLEVLDALHVLGNSYRLASFGVCSPAVYGRFILDFCVAFATSAADRLCKATASSALRQAVQLADGRAAGAEVRARLLPKCGCCPPRWRQ
jgi:hypothetical protein